MANSKSKDQPTVDGRPFATSPAPEHVRVDPCTAQTEWLKQLAPDAPQPVFSTMALMHSREMISASHLREGFSFNEKMDLLWAAGFPEVAFIMDGLPVQDTREALLALHGKSVGEENMWSRVQIALGCIYTRRGAMARVFEANENEESVMDFHSEDAFLKSSTPREVTDDDLINVFRYLGHADKDALLLEALVGPDRVVNAGLEILEQKVDVRSSYYDILSSILPVARRLPPAQVSGLQERISKWLPADADSSISAAAERLMNLNDSKRDLTEYCDRFFKPEVLRDWEYQNDMDDAYCTAFSAINSTPMLAGLLLVGARKESEQQVSAWFHAHQRQVTGGLQSLSQLDDKQVAKLAKQRAGALT